MPGHPLRWALPCVAAAVFPLCAGRASASQTAVVQHNDTIERIAHRYHVAVVDIAHANGISPNTVLHDGRKLVIPSGPHALVKPPTMRQSGLVTGDRIAVRFGPDESRRRVMLLDSGAKLVVTRRAGDWLQVEAPNGKAGWIRGDYVKLTGAAPARVAAAPRTRKHAAAIASAHRDKHAVRVAKLAAEHRAAAARHHRIQLARATEARQHAEH